MLTHGTGTPGNGNWEINTSFNTDIARESEYTLPLLDFNYGFKEHTQLKFEIPYVFTQPKNKIGNAVMGIKHRFTDEDNHFISFSVYPQIEFSFNGDGDTEYKLLTQFKKTMGRLVVCEELGFIYVPKNSNLFMSGTLIINRYQLC